MDHSLFLAKLIGIYLLTLRLLLAARRLQILEEVKEFFASRPMVSFSGLLALAVGIAMAIGHSVWESNWRGPITRFGYLSVANLLRRAWHASDFPKCRPRRSTSY